MTMRQGGGREYRADIDGLRAVAVLLVVLNHLQFNHFSGGYVGVDVFFVISGYLIGASLIDEFRKGTFSLTGFYERRIRRIFPALLAMLLGATAMAYRYLMPKALSSYAASLLAALFSFSNFLFWHQAGYFDTPSANKPLLHTWSLAVEEQFYIFFPLLLWAVFRVFPQRLRPVLWTVAAVTFALSVWVVNSDPSTAFFWSPLRAWELLAGVLVSQYAPRLLHVPWIREAAAALGLALILYPGARYTSQTPFPGLSALFPCLGTALIIAAGQAGNSLAGRLLSLRPVTFIGLISYSLYLWHWPILVCQNVGLMLSDRPVYLSRNTKLEILALSLVAATLSWRFVETPFRKGRMRLSRKPLFALTGAIAALIAGIAIFTLRADGMPSRFPQEVVRVASFDTYDTAVPWRQDRCFLLPTDPFTSFKASECLDVVLGKKQYLLVGDSTAAELYPGLVAVFPEIHFQQATSAACKPFRHISEIDTPYQSNCEAMWKYLHTEYLTAQHPDAVILAAATGNQFDALGDEVRFFQQHGIPVIVVGPEMRYDMPLPLLLSIQMRRRDSGRARAESTTRHLLEEIAPDDQAMRHKARDEWHVRYISPMQNLCGQQVEMVEKAQWETTNGCPLFASTGEPMIFDEHHLTIPGSIQFAESMRQNGQLP